MSTFEISGAGLIVVFLIGWVWQQKNHNAGIVDVIWAFATGACAIFYISVGDGDPLIRAVTFLICAFWFSRLGILLYKRVVGEDEDGRYQAMRAAMGKLPSQGFLALFVFQAGLAWLFALPMWMVATSHDGRFWQVGLALGIVVIAGFGVHTADRQLKLFKANASNRGKTCDLGLWKYSRHPNYFFEWVHWFVYPLLGFYSPWFYWLCLVPVLMFLFLYYVTGIPFSEQQAIRSRGENYVRYQQTTSAFIPWRQKKYVSNDLG